MNECTGTFSTLLDVCRLWLQGLPGARHRVLRRRRGRLSVPRRRLRLRLDAPGTRNQIGPTFLVDSGIDRGSRRL